MLRRAFHLRLAMLVALSPAACLAEGPDDSQTTEPDDGEDQEAPPAWHALVDDEAWQVQAPQDDPMPDHRPAIVECEHGWYPESGGIEIDTGRCSYLSLEQPLLHALEPGDPLQLHVWWQALASVEPAEGHLALYVDDELLWEEHVPIPGPAAARTVNFESPLGAPAGATLTLHLHNHGYNTWHFHELNVFSSPACPSCDATTHSPD